MKCSDPWATDFEVHVILSLTSLKVKSPLTMFRIWPHSFRSVRALQRSNCVAFKTRGFSNPSYTMTVWRTEEDLRAYFVSPAHQRAMKETRGLDLEIRSLRVDRDQLISWDEARELLHAAAPARR